MSDYEDMSASEVIADLHGEGYRHPDTGEVWNGAEFVSPGAYDSGTPCDGTGVEPAPVVTDAMVRAFNLSLSRIGMSGVLAPRVARAAIAAALAAQEVER